MGRPKLYASHSEKIKAYRYRKQNIPYKLVQGFVIRTEGNDDFKELPGKDIVHFLSLKNKTLERNIENKNQLPRNGKINSVTLQMINQLLDPQQKFPKGSNAKLVKKAMADRVSSIF